METEGLSNIKIGTERLWSGMMETQYNTELVEFNCIELIYYIVLKSEATLLQSVTGITKWGKHYYNVRQLQFLTK